MSEKLEFDMESFFHSLRNKHIHGKRLDTGELRQTLRTYSRSATTGETIRRSAA